MSLVFIGTYCEMLKSQSYVNYVGIRPDEENINKYTVK